MAVGLGVAESCLDLESMTNELCQDLMLQVRPGISLNPLKGIICNYYQNNRKADILEMCQLLIK